jgi:NAD(P)-dependent dehydrogenase (short-subunit alcohol dehydrogenase family)
MTSLHLDGLRVLITAGASGIGRVIAKFLFEAGAKVHICDIEVKLLNNCGGEFPGMGTTVADVSDETAVDHLFADVQKNLGGLDAVVNNAGIAGPTGAVEDIDPKEWRRCIEIDLTGQFLVARRAVPMLKASGSGTIINMSSAAGRLGYAFRTPYASAKWGVIGFTQSLAKELGPHGISVNAILPGIVSGPRMEGVIKARADQLGIPYEEMEQEYLQKISLRRMVTAEDVAAMILFLVSPMGRNVSGQSIGVCGNVETL